MQQAARKVQYFWEGDESIWVAAILLQSVAKKRESAFCAVIAEGDQSKFARLFRQIAS